MKGNEIREKFLEYFERHGHTRVRSSPLLPANDPTLLFTNAGMNQFKDVFLGVEKREYVRATSSQKCLRAGGKHNDLDEVGKTARHQTFFEMLGNFSFGDYFKEDAIKFAWDFLINELKLDPERLWFTVFGGDDEVPADDEAAALWEKVGAKPERILRFGRKDNFWQMAETGPCGPNSEINYYLGEHPEDPNFNRADLVNGPGDTTMEIWNLVFMQYNRVEADPGEYKLEPLPKPSVDTGLGLERTAVIMQGKFSNYDTDLIRPIVDFTAKLAGREYDAETQEGFAMRVIADHARATAFSIADGILPGNEGRNYVLRKIMRRAIYQGRHALGFDDLFFYKVTNFVVDQMGEAYPELRDNRGMIERVVSIEEKLYASTVDAGLNRFDVLANEKENQSRMTIGEMVELAKRYEAGEESPEIYEYLLEIERVSATQEFKQLSSQVSDLIRGFKKVEAEFNQKYGPAIKLFLEKLDKNIRIVGNEIFRLYDTYGLREDLIEYAAEQRGFEVDREGFEVELEKQRQLARESWKAASDRQVSPVYQQIAMRGRPEFTGYTCTALEGVHVTSIVTDGEPVDALPEGDEGEVVLDRTPFYAESGGQVGDVGRLLNPVATAPGTDLIAIVGDTYSPAQGLIVHKVKVEKGTLKVGDVVTAEVDVEKRDATRRNHTATHLMHAALREVLGTHVKQAGSVVTPNYLRFDFSHYQPLTTSEIEEVERLVNYHILRNEPVQTDEMAVEEAMRSGAMALFGEKYGEKVRVLSIKGAEGIFSKELCGGTHVRATGDIGVFKITSDESIASGVRRIRAVTGVDAYERFREDEEIIGQVTSNLRTSRAELPAMIGKLQDELKKARREADDLRLKIATGAAGSASSNGDDAREVNGVRVLAREASGLDAAGMRQLSDTLLARIKSGVVVVGRSNEGKASLIVRTSDDLTKKIPAGLVIKELAPIIGGKGGGKPDMAEGGGNQPEKLTEALEASYGVVERMLS
ncbi:MAG: alanyl-tRNA synthetase [Blastocatellia bacterium]|jgi:alanyl-tRNA synthetase|nr:alanyl-tRNA synthetase [Blastocatellia bacterium]